MLTDRARRVGIYPSSRRYVRASLTTHSGPLQGPTGPASLSGYLSSSNVAGWLGTRYYPPGIPSLVPTQYPYPPCTPSPPHHTEHPLHPRYCSFGHLVGEPRGSRTHL